MAFGAPSLKGKALRYLAQREHSRAELARKLHQHLARQARAQAGRPASHTAGHEAGHETDSDAGHEAGHDAATPDAATPADPQGNLAAATALVDSALDELAAHGLISDERAAASVLHSQGPRSGERRLKQALQAKGLAAELVASTLAQARGGEYERAVQLWQRRFGQPAHNAAERARQARYLQGRGFGFDIISRVLRAAGTPTPDPDISDACPPDA